MSDHCVFRNGDFFCTNCGGSFTVNLPMNVSAFVDKSNAFTTLHKDCEKTWEEPTHDPDASEDHRAKWWWENCERGSSSEFMFYFFIGSTGRHPHHPHDPDDFSRCYKLLEIVPEWRDRMHELRSASPEWHKLVDVWPELTKLFEDKKYHEMLVLMNEALMDAGI